MQLIKRARLDFAELLLENVDQFVGPILFAQRSDAAAAAAAATDHSKTQQLAGLDENDMRRIHDKLQEDKR